MGIAPKSQLRWRVELERHRSLKIRGLLVCRAIFVLFLTLHAHQTTTKGGSNAIPCSCQNNAIAAENSCEITMLENFLDASV